jgi:UDP-glucuronate 4-epimerase
LPINVYGDGTTARDYTYCLDTVSGIVSAIGYVSSRSGVYDIFNLGNNQPVSLMELIQTIAKVCQKEPQLIFEEKKLGDVDITYASIEKAKQHLNYQPQTSLEEGISRFVSWYKKEQQLS